MKQFLSIGDVKDFNALVQKAMELKKSPFNHQELGRNKTMVLLFLNPSFPFCIDAIIIPTIANASPTPFVMVSESFLYRYSDTKTGIIKDILLATVLIAIPTF